MSAVTGWPTSNQPEFAQLEPAPVTMAVPLEPESYPTWPYVFVTPPPFSTVSAAEVDSPTLKFPDFAQLTLVRLSAPPPDCQS